MENPSNVQNLERLLHGIQLLDEKLIQISLNQKENKKEIELLNFNSELYEAECQSINRFHALLKEIKSSFTLIFDGLQQNPSIVEISEKMENINILKIHKIFLENSTQEHENFQQKIIIRKEENNNLKKHIKCFEDSILYLETILEEFHEKFLKILAQRFESHNDIYLKNLEAQKKSNHNLLKNLKLETHEIKEMYEKRIEIKEQEIKMISENYKKRLYEKFNDKVSRDIKEVENEAIEHSKVKNLEAEELKMKIKAQDTKMKKKQKKQTKKENLDEFNSKFYHLRK